MAENQELKKSTATDYNELLERMPEMEEAARIVLDAASVVYNRPGQGLYVYCEIRPASGSKLSFDLKINVVLYDRNGRILDKDDRHLYKDDFSGFDVPEIIFTDITPKKMAEIGKIRIFPTKR